MVWGKALTSSFACGYLVVSAPFIEKTIPSLLNGLGTLVKNRLTIGVSLPYISNESTSFLRITFSTSAIIFESIPRLELFHSLLWIKSIPLGRDSELSVLRTVSFLPWVKSLSHGSAQGVMKVMHFSQSDTPALVAEHSMERVGQQLLVPSACLFQHGTPVNELGPGWSGPQILSSTMPT